MATSFRNYSLDLHDQTLGQAHFRCVALHQLVQDNPVFVGVKPGMYCFEVDKPALRVKITSDFVYQALYNDLHLFQNHYIADNIRITRNSEPLLNIHVENIESLTTVQDADFIAPADAVQPDFQSRRIVGSLDPRSILRRDPPVYPVGARAMGVHGTVVIQQQLARMATQGTCT
jgi:hypothetical protein